MKPDQFTINRLSTVTGIDRRTLKRRLADAGAKPDARGEYSAAAVLPFLRERRDVADPKRKLECRRLQALCERVEFENAVRRKDFVPLAVVKRDCGRQILVAKQMFLNAIDSVTAAAAMKLALTPQQSTDLRQILQAHVMDALHQLNAGPWKNPPCPHCGKPISEKDEQ